MTEESLLPVEFIYCECGCGLTRSKYDWQKREYKYIYKHSSRGKKFPNSPKEANHHSWKGGEVTSVKGYRLKRDIKHPKATKQGYYVFEHVLVMEKHLGRYLMPDEVVHHINGNKLDNRIENLQLMKKGEHIRYHRLKDKSVND